MNPRVKAFLLFVLFLVVAQILGGGLEWLLLSKLQLITTRGQPWRPSFFVFWELPSIIGALAATYLIARLNKRTFSELGYRTDHVARQFGSGAALGFIAMTATVLLATAFGGYSFGEPMMGFIATTGYALAWFAAMLGTAIAAEMIFHGAGLITLAEATGFWPASVIVSLLMAGLTLGPAGQNRDFAAALTGFIVSMLACYTVRRTGAIWFAIGLHAMLDFSALFIYGSPSRGNVGGEPIDTRLFYGGFHGADWITGGAAGLESSWILFPIVVVLSLLVFYRMRDSSQPV